ncbi:beta-lactamase family protein [Hoyosella sp. G463]|uniref:Beta-lactamase family protein n=1 Tax=Lolliginicoccus lacisalsi TaxID=2742202 RepID=A0A927PMY7_9ACTN|nr:serine hydrolase domain-containing protein [Lolliginicoccus lacisalsi]MBD8507006.1 beta-lactamase family protein [Lolliginicoccus lacisalsi]
MSSRTGEELTVHGHADERFAPVVEAFTRNFTHHHEIGAALAIYEHGKPVVDVWAGYRDLGRGLPWQRDTRAPVFSTTKGITALVIASAVSRGVLDYDTAVTEWWPEFGQHGKRSVTLRQLLDHQAGLPVISAPLRTADLHDLDALAGILAAEQPRWEPGTRHGYHPTSLGFYLNELFRRADPGHRTIGQYLAEEIAGPRGLLVSIGTAVGSAAVGSAAVGSTGSDGAGTPGQRSIGTEELAVLRGTTRGVLVDNARDIPWRMVLDIARHAALKQPRIAAEALANPRVGLPQHASRASFLAPEMPSSNAVATARAIAALYSDAATPGASEMISDELRAELAAPSVPGAIPDHDMVLNVPSRYHLGFRKPHPTFPFGRPPGPTEGDGRAFGTTGIGGSFGYADPTAGIGFGYVMNQLGVAMLDDPRPRRIRAALDEVLAKD